MLRCGASERGLRHGQALLRPEADALAGARQSRPAGQVGGHGLQPAPQLALAGRCTGVSWAWTLPQAGLTPTAGPIGGRQGRISQTPDKPPPFKLNPDTAHRSHNIFLTVAREITREARCGLPAS